MTGRRGRIGCVLVAALASGIPSASVAQGSEPRGVPETRLAEPPRIIGEGTISTPAEEFKQTVSPDGSTLIYTVTGHRFRHMTIVEARRRGDGWSRPEVAPFSGIWRDGDPSFSPDGRTLLFISNRPLPGDPPDTVRRDFNIWKVERHANGRWGEPVALDRGVNSAASEFAPSVGRSGTLYFSRGDHMYRAAVRGTVFDMPVQLPLTGGDPAISPDERFLVFDADGPKPGDTDLFVSCRLGDGWSAPSRLADSASTDEEEGDPSIGADGRALYFFSRRVARVADRAPRARRATYAEVEREALDDVYNGSRNLYQAVLPSSICSGAEEAPLGSTATVQELAPGVVSTGHEFGATFTPDGRTLLFTRVDTVARRAHLYASVLRDGVWQPATPLGFSRADWSDLDPSVSPDGRRLYFVSTRPHPGAATSARDMDIWYADAADSGWGEPTWIAELSSAGKEGSPTVDRAGTICFFTDRQGPPGHNEIYCATRTPSGFGSPSRLGPTINAGPSDTSPFLSPDGRTLLFYSTRVGGAGQGDLYVSVKTEGRWGPAVNLGPLVNTPGSEYNPVVSRDGAVLIFGRAGRLLYVSLGALAVPELTASRFRME
ncbi:MAG TPA: hypothetical protein VF041_14455 [Gemmatimonadaceae bacterium]